nr:8729_t:CDS:2 [Entrophospora candida]
MNIDEQVCLGAQKIDLHLDITGRQSNKMIKDLQKHKNVITG